MYYVLFAAILIGLYGLLLLVVQATSRKMKSLAFLNAYFKDWS